MDGDDFLSDILLDGDNDDDVVGLDAMNIPRTQETESVQEVDQVEVEVQASGARKGSKRTKKFDPKEDKVICSGWLNISKDPIHGANQTKEGFWKRVHAFFEKNKKTTTERSKSAIMHRWLTIQTQVNKFCAVYDHVERRPKSGATGQDMVCHMFSYFI